MSVWVKVNLWYQDEESPASTHGRLWRKRWRVWAVNTMSQRSTYSSWLQVTLQPVCSWMIGGCSFFPVSTPHYIQQNQQWTVRRGTDTAEVRTYKGHGQYKGCNGDIQNKNLSALLIQGVHAHGYNAYAGGEKIQSMSTEMISERIGLQATTTWSTMTRFWWNMIKLWQLDKIYQCISSPFQHG